MNDVLLPNALRAYIDRYDAWIKGRMHGRQETVREVLYHYTDWRALEGILTSQTVWFTHYGHLNDRLELVFGIEVAQEVIARMRTESASSREDSFLHCLSDMFTLDKIRDRLAFYVGSFSKARDEAHLWGSYASNGAGFAIGLAPQLFELENELRLVPHENSFLETVTYGAGGVSWNHRRAIEKARDLFLKAFVQREADLEVPAHEFLFAQEMCRAVLASPLIWNCLVAKVDRYRPEKEFRIAILGQRDPLQPAVEFRNRSHDAIIERVPYIPFAYPLKQSGSIAEIVVGPVAPADAEDRVLRCLAALGYAYEIRIRRSTLDW